MIDTLTTDLLTADRDTMTRGRDAALDGLRDVIAGRRAMTEAYDLAVRAWWYKTALAVAEADLTDAVRAAVHRDLAAMLADDAAEAYEIYTTEHDYMRYRVRFIAAGLREAERAEAARARPGSCARCGGLGYISAFKHVDGGRCYGCGGEGVKPT